MRLVTAVLAVCLLAGACSGGDDDPDVASIDGASEADGGGSDGGDSVDAEAALLDFSKCMRSEGIARFPDLDEGSTILDVPQAGIDPFTPEFEAAVDECEPLLDGVVFNTDLDPEQEAELRDTALEIVRCMRDRGWDLPEPAGIPDADYFQSLGDSGIDVNDPDLLRDAAECFRESGFGQTDG